MSNRLIVAMFLVVALIGAAPLAINYLSAQAGDEVVDRLIEVVKDDSASYPQRAKACAALGKRGSKAKRAVPEMVKLLDALRAFAEDEKDGRRVIGNVALVAQGLGGIGAEAKDAVAPLVKILLAPDKELLILFDRNEDHVARVAIAQALGKIGSPEAFTALSKASAGRLDTAIRKGAVRGLGYIAENKESDLRAKARAQLEVVVETDGDERVRMVARNVLEGKDDPTKCAPRGTTTGRSTTTTTTE